MPSFKDCNNKEWLVAVDGPLVREVRQELGVDLIASDASQFVRLQSDPILLVDVLWVLCREQAGDKVSARDFGRALKGDAIQFATDALLRAIADFFPRGRREMLLRMIDMGQSATAKAEAALAARMRSSGLEDQITKAMNAEIDRLLAQASIPSDAATNSPESSESAPTA